MPTRTTRPVTRPTTENDAFSRGYVEGNLGGRTFWEAQLAVRLLEHLHCLEADVRLGLRHDVATPLDVVRVVREWLDAWTEG